MTPVRPYLIRAIHSWLVDNGLTPHLLADTSIFGVNVPLQYVENNRILLNISPSATHSLLLGDDAVSFSARFGGNPFLVRIPVHAVVAVYARENGKGMVFQDEEPPEPDDSGSSEPSASPGSRPGKPSLSVVK